MKLRLTRRVWIMIAFSLIWAIGASIHTRHVEIQSAEDFAKFAYESCAYGKEVRHETDLSSCDAARQQNLKTWMESSIANVAIAGLVPIPFAWLGGFILLYIGRAQLIGFHPAVPWTTLTRARKLFVVFCCLFSAASVLFGIVILLDLYVDTKVRVSPAPFLDVIKTGDDLVTAEGTWTRTDLTDDTAKRKTDAQKRWPPYQGPR